MAMIKHPYELSVWKEKLNGSNSKIEEKGVIIGAHDMTYLGKATNLVLTRKLNGTNTLTFQMPDKYFDYEKGDYVHNELIDVLYTESKLKLFYKDRWYEFFIKKTDEKKLFKSYMVQFTCTDAFIDELSRNGYGITFDTELYNNVEEIGTFTEETLDGSIWQYHPENNWGDFTEYKEEKLYRIPVNQFKGLNGYKLDFELEESQLQEMGTDEIVNLFTKESRPAELSDDLARGQFWDQQGETDIINKLTKHFIEDIPNDGYIYIPYTCLSFCYGSDLNPDTMTGPLHYDRAATETALSKNNKLVLAPQSVDPRTIIQFYAIPEGAILEIDDAGVILNKEYSYFVKLPEWNEMISGNGWYIFEDTRLVEAEVLGSIDEFTPSISHTFKYLKDSNETQEALGNKYVTYDGYLSDINNIGIIKGKKFSITDRSEINISEEIDQYVTVYNTKATEFANEYISSDWIFNEDTDGYYRVCSKIDTRQVIPQLARNLVQNGKDMDSVDGWAPMKYLLDSTVTTPTVSIRGIIIPKDGQTQLAEDDSITTTALQFIPAIMKVASKVTVSMIPGTNMANLYFDYPTDFKPAAYFPKNLNRIYWHHDFVSYNAYPSFEGIRNWLGASAEKNPDTVDSLGRVCHNYGDTPNTNECLQFYDFLRKMWSLANANGGSGSTIYSINKTFYERVLVQLTSSDPVPSNLNDFKQWLRDAHAKQCQLFNFDVWAAETWANIYTQYPDNNMKRAYLNSLARPFYKFLFTSGDWVFNGLKNFMTFIVEKDVQTEDTDSDGDIFYTIENGDWNDLEGGTNAVHWVAPYGPYVTNEDGQKWRFPYHIGALKLTETPVWKQTADEGKEIVNFGIIGQQQTIQKDKIYCLGMSGYTNGSTNITIKIGKGTLISEGNYNLVDTTILKFNQLSLSSFPQGTKYKGNEKDNIVISQPPALNFILFKSEFDIENPYFVIESQDQVLLFKLFLFEAYTKGRDCFPDDGSLMYKYSGRDLFWDIENAAKYKDQDNKLLYTYFPIQGVYSEEQIRNKIIFEDDIMLGTTYGYERYFIQRLVAKKTNEDKTVTTTYYDTMGKKAFLASDKKDFIEGELPLDAAQYTEDDYEIQTNYIDLNKCKYYIHETTKDQPDCKYGDGNHICFYQKFGYCPYRLETEKHPRRSRTLSVSKSNRFNIIQLISKVFEIYPQFYIEHLDNGKVTQDENGYIKKVFYITEKGKENKIGFRYEKNLKDISRTINSEQIVTKLYVLDVDSELSRTGLCSIKSAEDNPSKDSFLIDLSYYIAKGMLDEEEVEQDLYGITPLEESLEDNPKLIPAGFLYQLGYYNGEYDKLTNKIINLQDASFNELQANVVVNLEGIVTAQEQVLKIKKQLNQYKDLYNRPGSSGTPYTEQSTYKNYLVKLSEQESILTQLIYTTFFTNGETDTIDWDSNLDLFYPTIEETSSPAFDFFNHIKDFDGVKKLWYEQHQYHSGILGQYNAEYQQIQQWKLERASYLKLINQISNAFYIKYEPYLKEGTWSDSNYLTDNAYYFGALDVAAEGAIPKVTYNISVVDISGLSEENEDIYNFDLCDVTYVEDIGMFGINPKTGLPNRLKVLIAEVTENIDDESKNNIKVQNFTTQFDDLFQQVTASIQSLTFNENIYKRSSNFTSLQNIKNDSLQGALDTNELTLLNTDEQNIQVDNMGTRGSDINNHANKYKLDGQGLYFSNDGGQHWSVGVGPSGINADYIKVGNLDASKIRIVDGNFIYFYWDKEGIIAYRDPQAINTTVKNINDAAIFNRYGLSVVQDGKIKLRAGYSYAGEHNDFNSERDQGDEIGFYLYNNDGYPIFSASNSDETDGAQIRLQGEMIISDAITSEGSYSYESYYYKKKYSKTTIDIYHADSNSSFSSDIAVIIDTTQYTKTGETSVSNSYLSYRGGIYPFSTIETWTANDPLIVPQTIQIGKAINSSSQPYYLKITEARSIDYLYIYSDVQSSDYFQPLPQGNYSGYYNDYSSRDNYQLLYYPPFTLSQGFEDSSDGSRWKEQYFVPGSGGVVGQVALLLNNLDNSKRSSTAQENTDSRMFVCAKNINGRAKNILSILKGGQLFIGGDIIDTNNNDVSIDAIPNKIKVKNAGILIDSNGNVCINFNQIRQDGQSIDNYVDQAVGGRTPWGHRHQLGYYFLDISSDYSGNFDDFIGFLRGHRLIMDLNDFTGTAFNEVSI